MNTTQKQAFKNPLGDLFSLSEKWIAKGIKASQESSRKRIILPIHRRQEAEVQRLVNFLQPGTYIRPHKHPMPHATESIVVLKGSVRFFTFDEKGDVITDHLLRSAPLPGILDIEPEVWHTFTVEEPDTILFECKKGPYDAKTDKVFAEWAPGEGAPESAEFMKRLHR